MYNSDINVCDLIKIIDVNKKYLTFMFVNVILGKTENFKNTISMIVFNLR